MPSSSLRQTLRAKRQALSEDDRCLYSAKIAEYLFNFPFYLSANRVACYFSMKEEVNTRLILQGILAEGKQCYLPRLLKGQSKMEFVHYCEDDTLAENQFGILEPCLPEREAISVIDLDLVLAPLVGFDQQGNRLGMGAGYYDRALANKQDETFYCGLAFSCQRVEALVPNVWDVPLDTVLTELG